MYRVIYNSIEIIEIVEHDEQSITYFNTSLYSAIIDTLENAETALIGLGVDVSKITEFRNLHS